jgi:glycosyltransferase involved in cell wall biosynthesis
MPESHPGTNYQFCYRPHRFIRSFRQPVPPNVSRNLLLPNWPRRIDLFHALNQRVDSTHHRRVVTTFHDLFVMTSEYSTPEFRARFAEQARLAAQRSDLIIAVSQFTADQVHQLLGVERARLRVIYHGVKQLPAAKQAPTREPAILSVGAIQKRKNILRLVQAFEQTPPGWKLILAGSTGYGAGEIMAALAASPRRTDLQLKGYVTDEELADLYAKASIFAFPSLDEGFGMPVIEAMAHAVPVLTSNCSALTEISGDAALKVDPSDVGSITSGLLRLIGDEGLRNEFALKGLAHSANFTWERAIEQTWDAYRELTG